MTYKIGGVEFEDDTTLAEVEQQLKKKNDFKEFANQTFKAEIKLAQDLIDEVSSFSC